MWHFSCLCLAILRVTSETGIYFVPWWSFKREQWEVYSEEYGDCEEQVIVLHTNNIIPWKWLFSSAQSCLTDDKTNVLGWFRDKESISLQSSKTDSALKGQICYNCFWRSGCDVWRRHWGHNGMHLEQKYLCVVVAAFKPSWTKQQPWRLTESQDGSMDYCIGHHHLNPQTSSAQATVLWSSKAQFWWACAHYSRDLCY